jgi:hypothetical protein
MKLLSGAMMMKNTLFIIGIVLLIIGVIGGIHYNSKNAVCKGALSQLAQVFSTQTTQECSTTQSLMYVSFALAVVGLVLVIVGATDKRR